MPISMKLEEQEKCEGELDSPGEANEVNLQAKHDLAFHKVVEAALFLANRELTVKELSKALERKPAEVRRALERIRAEREASDSPAQLIVDGERAFLQVKPVYLSLVGGFSKKSDLSRKATRILALIVKKGRLLQKDLKQYFRGEIYAYVTELREAGYVESTRYKNTRILKPTRKFYDEFQLDKA